MIIIIRICEILKHYHSIIRSKDNNILIFISEGIYDDVACTSTSVNHAMLVVGFEKDYWILKNWWGARWGEAGYMRLRKGNNLCGIANYAAYAIVWDRSVTRFIYILDLINTSEIGNRINRLWGYLPGVYCRPFITSPRA